MRGQRSGFGFSHGISVYVLLFQLVLAWSVYLLKHCRCLFVEKKYFGLYFLLVSRLGVSSFQLVIKYKNCIY